MNSGSNPYSMKSRVCACSSTLGRFHGRSLAANPIVASRNRLGCFSSPPNAPLTMNKMCLVLMVLGAFLAALREVHHRLDLAGNVLAASAPALPSPPSASTNSSAPRARSHRGPSRCRRRDLVNLVNVDDSVLRALHVAVRPAHSRAPCPPRHRRRSPSPRTSSRRP